MRLLPLVIVAAGGCVSATFHSQTGLTPPVVTDRAVAAPSADVLGGQAQYLGTVNLSARTATGDGQGNLLDKAAKVAANHGGTHLVVRAAGTAESDYTTPASKTRTCTRDGDTRTCETTYVPESTGAVYTPYATYDVYRVDPSAWQALPADERPIEIAPERLTPVGADGAAVTIGWFTQAYAGATSGTGGFVFPTAYTQDRSQVNGVWISSSTMHGSTVIAADLGLGGGTVSGYATNLDEGNATSYTTTYGGIAAAIRVGKQVAWRDVAFALGGGVGGGVWAGEPQADDRYVFVEPPSIVGDLQLPLWASFTLKPSCDWGVQALAEYQVRPLDTSASAPAFGIGVIWQPASACR